jgi:light-harvesting complex 1 beta chain
MSQPRGMCAVHAERQQEVSMADNHSSITGLTDEEAREFHSFFVSGFIGFTIIALVAHFLVWQWRPWFPGVKGYALFDGVVNSVQTLIG